ncbi:MAG: hypothetical protein J5880_02235, partial [Bacilli bacterium]|nr:hypothetical protein [Bacilli bacterium]MBO4682673.1 hypothetical protein [Bacilli bacterium]
FKIVLFSASVMMMLLCRQNWPTRLYSTIISVIYLVILLIVLIVDGFKNRREIREAAEEEKYKNNQDSSNQ